MWPVTFGINSCCFVFVLNWVNCPNKRPRRSHMQIGIHDECVSVLNPVGDSEFFFVPHSWHADYFHLHILFCLPSLTFTIFHSFTIKLSNFEIMVKSLQLAWIGDCLAALWIIRRQYQISFLTNMAACPSFKSLQYYNFWLTTIYLYFTVSY